MYHFIVNPNARTGMGRKVWTRIEPLLNGKQIDYQVYFTEYSGHATDIAREITSLGVEVSLTVLGGDGTVNEVVNGIACFDNVIFSYIPAGSSNDFARGLKLPTEPEVALEMILQRKNIRTINIGSLYYDDKEKLFAVSSGIGFDAAISHAALTSRLKKLLNWLKLGKLTYVGIALKQLSLLKLKKMTITLDNGDVHTFDHVYFAAAMNLPYEGGGFMFAPKAQPDDGLLEVCVAEGLSKTQVLTLLPKAFKGNHIHSEGIHIYSCKSVRLEADEALAVHTDGESAGFHKVVEMKCSDNLLKIIAAC